MNRFFIEQTKEETDLAVSLHRHAELAGVRLSRVKASGDRPEDAIKDQMAFSIDVKAKQAEALPNQLIIEVGFRLTGKRKTESGKEKTVLCIESAFEITYQLRPEFAPTAEQIAAFKDGNAIFNCWPYCREHVQESLIRMGFPALALPFLRVVTRQREAKKQPKQG